MLTAKGKDSAPRAQISGDMFKINDLIIDPGRYEVKAAGSPINLTPTEFGIFQLLT